MSSRVLADRAAAALGTRYFRGVQRVRGAAKWRYVIPRQPSVPPQPLAVGVGPNRIANLTKATTTYYRTLEERMRWHGYNGLSILLGSVGLVAGIIYWKREPIRENISTEIKEVTKRSLADQQVKQTAQQLSKQIVERLLTDPETANAATEFVNHVLSSEATRAAAGELAANVLSQPQVIDQARVFSQDLVGWLTQQDYIHEHLVRLIQGLLMDPATRIQVARLLGDLLSYDYVKQESVRLGTYTANMVLQDPTVHQYSVDHVTHVISDAQLQQRAGDSLWAAVQYSITPQIFMRKSRSMQQVQAEADFLDSMTSSHTANQGETNPTQEAQAVSDEPAQDTVKQPSADVVDTSGTKDRVLIVTAASEELVDGETTIDSTHNMTPEPSPM
eukprot:m.211265 g.211265  ORF g.211265 m.211265 type:complete len:389 (+) comp15058_c0_seq1:264-1430(+)